ncbi:tryptophan transporter [Inediibacterium massiliense]|uniref:tryptophan transporter n=1 Tax=Inediibacterium massiliense TaxID=1658111 RepID=UPI0006B57AD7|nr:tryptophan transporter [Inediibacterium massiliense]
MGLRKNMITALLIALGFILRQVVPGSIGGMSFDIVLSMMFICLIIDESFKGALLTAFLGGVITAMTTTFPGGQIPNLIDKIVTCIVLFLVIKIMGHLKNNIIGVGILAFIGTIVSGGVFLLSASYLVGLPAPLKALFIGVVLPATIMNIGITVVVYKAVKVSLKALGLHYIHE